MSTHKVIAHADPVTHQDLKDLADHEGPNVSFYLPTHRSGPETRTDSQVLRELIDDARASLAEHYPDMDADWLLSPVERLRDDEPFWQEQVDGLAMISSKVETRYFRTDSEFSANVTVSEHPNLRPLIPLTAGNMEFLLLAVSQNEVRLFEADRLTIMDLPLGDIPGGWDDVLGTLQTDPPTQKQQGSATGTAHGGRSGTGEQLSGYLQAVAKAVESRFAGSGKPLVIASVREYQSDLAEPLNSVQLLGAPVAGNPEGLSGPQLHEHAWPLVAEEAGKRHAAQLDSFGEAIGTGLASSDPADIVAAADAARVETLLFTETALELPQDASRLDAAVAKTLVNGGAVDVVPELPDGLKFGAIYRF